MFESLLITFHETLGAVLVIGIVLSLLWRLGRLKLRCAGVGDGTGIRRRRNLMPSLKHLVIILAAVSLIGCEGKKDQQEQKVLNIYSARHYGGDADLFGAFEKQTGIKVKVIEAKDGALRERIRREGKGCPADVLIMVDAGNLGMADRDGMFQPTQSAALIEALPENLRHPQGHWFGFGKRSRIIIYHPGRVKAAELPTYQGLTDPKWKGRIVIRSSSNIYNQSLLAAMVARYGEQEAEAWARGVVANMARSPQGNDRAQIKAVASGEADLAVVNHYYYAKMLASSDPAEVKAANAVAIHFPDQGTDGKGAHTNISGAGVLTHAPHPESARRFLEFMASPKGQQLFVSVSHEFPAAKGVDVSYPMFPPFKADILPVAKLAEHNPTAVKIFDRVGWR